MTHYLWDSPLSWLQTYNLAEARFCSKYNVSSDQIQDHYEAEMSDSGYFLDFDEAREIINNWGLVEQMIEDGDAPITRDELATTIADAILSDVRRELMLNARQLAEYVLDLDFSEQNGDRLDNVADFVIADIREQDGDKHDLPIDSDDEEE
jgi:DNA primase large subunit